MKIRLYIREGVRPNDERVAETVEIDELPVEGNVLTLRDGRRLVNVTRLSDGPDDYDGTYAAAPLRE